jgi:NAD(P)-dependent dehydrogenase (short-subunit alcohol dehydrogenase family)
VFTPVLVGKKDESVTYNPFTAYRAKSKPNRNASNSSTLEAGAAVALGPPPTPRPTRARARERSAASAFDVGFAGRANRESGAVKNAIIAGIPLRRMAAPEDVTAAVLFLAPGDAAFLTGVCRDVDGGRSIS